MTTSELGAIIMQEVRRHPDWSLVAGVVIYANAQAGPHHSNWQAGFSINGARIVPVDAQTAAGLSFSLGGGASASTTPTAGIPQSDNTSPNLRFTLSDEEMFDVSLAAFYVFD
jgi:hypothetical protein